MVLRRGGPVCPSVNLLFFLFCSTTITRDMVPVPVRMIGKGKIMSFTQAILSGIVQGLTEFLPVSSSGHLVLLHRFFGFAQSDMFFDVCLHAATLAAVVLYFRKDIIQLIREKDVKLIVCVGIATVPAVVAALLCEDKISLFFADYRKTAFMLMVTGMILFAGQFFLKKNQLGEKPVSYSASFLVGIAQAFALFPGISRSGATISAGLAGGLKREEAFRFSFLISIPIVAGAVIYKVLKPGVLDLVTGEMWVKYVFGMITAFIGGFLSLNLLWKFIKAGKLFVFGIYCILLGAGAVLFLK